MTKITLTWQGDKEHRSPFTEEIELEVTELESDYSVHNVESEFLSKESTPPRRLGKLEGSAINVVLDDCIQQLSIIKFLLNENISPSWNDLFKYHPLAERFKSSARKKKQFQEETYEKVPYSNHQKLQKDICFLTTTLTELCREVKEKGDYKVLLKVLEGVKKEEEDNTFIENQKRAHEEDLKTLNKTMQRETKEFDKAVQEANQTIWEYKNQVEDILFYGKQELRYTVDWEKARTYQNELRLSEAEDEHNNTISYYSTSIEYENRIHNEIRNFIEENTEDLQNSINYWMQHYDDEIERRDSEIIRLKMIWEELSEAHVALKAQYEERTAFVEERRRINEERRIAAELLRVQTAASIKIQAWWRGTMVRKKLGPFRVKKKGKNKDKGKGKKKKK